MEKGCGDVEEQQEGGEVGGVLTENGWMRSKEVIMSFWALKIIEH